MTSRALRGSRTSLRRRRVLLLLIALLLVIGVSPVLGHHVLESVPWISATQRHLWVACLVSVHYLVAPIHSLAHVALYAGALFALGERALAIRRHARLMRSLRAAPVVRGSEIARAAARASVPLAMVREVQGLAIPAFTTGWIAPRIIVAADLPARLTDDELSAVIAHEAEHARRRDPLRVFALRTLSSLLFWLPALRRLTDDLADEFEIAADDAAAVAFASPLASAILKLGGGGEFLVEPAVGFQRADLLPRRIRRLAGAGDEPVSHVSTRALVSAFAALVLVWLSGTIAFHPLPAESHSPSSHAPHCEHGTASALSHLLCRGWFVRADSDACPHGALGTGSG